MTNSPALQGTTPDVIDLLVGIQPGDALDTVRRHRLQARTHAHTSYLALFAPTAPVPGSVTLAERHAVAAFVAGLHQQPEAAGFYAAALVAHDAPPGLAPAIAAEIAQGAARGPYGRYPAGPLSAEVPRGRCTAWRPQRGRFWVPGCLPRWSTRTCWCFVRAMPARKRCKSC